MDFHDAGQSLALATFAMVFLFSYLARTRDKKHDQEKHQKDREEIIIWRTNINKEIEFLNEKAKNLSNRDDMIAQQLADIMSEIRGMGERLVRIEAQVSGGKV